MTSQISFRLGIISVSHRVRNTIMPPLFGGGENTAYFGFTISRQSRSPLSRLCISASAVAIFVATGILCTSQSLKRLFSLGSCGFGLSGSRNIKRRSISLQAIRAPICWSPPCEPLKKLLYFKAGSFGNKFSCSAGCTKVMLRQNSAICYAKLNHKFLFFIVSHQSYIHKSSSDLLFVCVYTT